jgi:NitT/TauT family transport system substrate-binding protein
MKFIQTLLSFAAVFTLGFALIACEEEKTEKTEKNEESAFKFGTVEIPVSDGTLCIAPFFVAKDKGSSFDEP